MNQNTNTPGTQNLQAGWMSDREDARGQLAALNRIGRNLDQLNDQTEAASKEQKEGLAGLLASMAKGAKDSGVSGAKVGAVTSGAATASVLTFIETPSGLTWFASTIATALGGVVGSVFGAGFGAIKSLFSSKKEDSVVTPIPQSPTSNVIVNIPPNQDEAIIESIQSLEQQFVRRWYDEDDYNKYLESHEARQRELDRREKFKRGQPDVPPPPAPQGEQKGFFGNMLDGIKGFIGSLGTLFKGILRFAGPLAAVALLVSSLDFDKDILAPFTKIKDLFSEGKWLEGILRVITAIPDLFVKGVLRLSAKLMEFFGFEEVANTLSGFADSFDLLDMAASLFDTITQGVGKIGAKVLSFFGFEGAAKWLEDNLGNFDVLSWLEKFSLPMESIKQWFAEFDFYEMLNDIGSGIVSTFTSIGDWWKNFSLADTLTSLGDSFKSYFLSFQSGVNTFVTTVFERLKQSFVKLVDGVVSWWDSWSFYGVFIEPIVTSISNIATGIKNWWDSWSMYGVFIEPIVTSISNIATGIKNWWDSWSFYGVFIEPIVGSISAVATEVKAWWDSWSMYGVFIEPIVTSLTNVATGIKAWWDSWSMYGVFIEPIVTSLTNVATGIKAWWDSWSFKETFIDPIVGSISAVATGIKNWWDSWSFKETFVDPIVGGLGSVAGNIKSWWDSWSFTETFIDPIVGSISNIATGIKAWWDSWSFTETFIDPIVGSISNVATGIKAWWDSWDFKTEVIDPMIDGIKSMFFGIADWFKNFDFKILLPDFIRNRLGSEDPIVSEAARIREAMPPEQIRRELELAVEQGDSRSAEILELALEEQKSFVASVTGAVTGAVRGLFSSEEPPEVVEPVINITYPTIPSVTPDRMVEAQRIIEQARTEREDRRFTTMISTASNTTNNVNASTTVVAPRTHPRGFEPTHMRFQQNSFGGVAGYPVR